MLWWYWSGVTVPIDFCSVIKYLVLRRQNKLVDRTSATSQWNRIPCLSLTDVLVYAWSKGRLVLAPEYSESKRVTYTNIMNPYKLRNPISESITILKCYQLPWHSRQRVWNGWQFRGFHPSLEWDGGENSAASKPSAWSWGVNGLSLEEMDPVHRNSSSSRSPL